MSKWLGVRSGRGLKHSGFHKVAIRGALFVALSGVGFIGLGQTLAKEGTYDYMSCFSGEERASISTDSSHRAVLQDYTGSNRAAVALSVRLAFTALQRSGNREVYDCLLIGNQRDFQ